MLFYILGIWILPDIFKAYPTIIIVAVMVIGLSILASIIVYLIIFFGRVRASYIDIKTTKARKLISDKLNHYLFFMESVGNISRDDLRRVATELNKLTVLKFKSRLVRQLLIDQLVYFKKNFTSQTSIALSKLYQNLGLKEFSFNKLHTNSWEVKAQGIAELREMAPIMSATEILPYTNSSNDDLRVEAQAAYVWLNTADPFSFLNDTSEILVEWHQIILFDMITKNEEIIIPPFNKWLNSPNSSIIVFCIKLIIYYKQPDAVPSLIQLLDHSDINVQNRAINALGKLEAISAEPIMIAHYSTFSKSCKLEVLKALRRINSKTSIQFLRAEFLKIDNFYIAKCAMYSIVAISGYTRAQLLAGLPELNAEQKAIINHCFDKLINI